MKSKPLAVVILAAGKGTRMKSPLPKVMHELAGKPIISILIEQVEQLSPERIIVVTGPNMANLRELVKPHQSVIQKQQNGTGDALKAALPALEGFKGNVLVLMGDEPFTSVELLRQMAAHNGLSVMAIIPPDPAGLGRMIMGQGDTLEAIVEEKDCTPEQREIFICNAGNYCIPAEKLLRWLPQIGNKNAQGEYYLTDLPQIAKKDGAQTKVFALSIDYIWGVNDRVQLAQHEQIYQERLREKFLNQGVSMQDPATVYFHHDTKIGENVRIEPNVWFGGGVQIGNNVLIKAFSHIEGAKIGKGTTVGPFARLRPGSKIGEDVRIGNFVEVKKSTIGDRCKVSHLAYVGDCIMGDETNFGCGAITVNYDGFEKYQTVIGKGAMVGSNVNLVAPIAIDDGAFIAAGSTITEDVPADALSVGRSKNEIRKGWAAKFRKIKAQKRAEAQKKKAS